MGKPETNSGPPSSDNAWASLIEIHNHTKSVFLCAEEFDSEFREFLQPVLELRHAFEHIVRAKAAELGLNKDAETDVVGYVSKSFDKAIGHEYRAFFDAADWFSVCIRERIITELRPFSHECITAVLPEYYPKLRPRIESICQEIAAIRADKDIAKDKLVEEVKKYRQALDDLLLIHQQIQRSIPALVDWKRKNRMGKVTAWVWCAFVGGIVVAVVAAWILQKLRLTSQ
jgi:hypothetical protein